MTKPAPRNGFTLMEVLLASTIAVFVMIAVLTMMEIQLREMSEGRARVEQSAVSHAILAKMSDDISPTLSPVLPTVQSKSSGSGSSGAGSGMSSSGSGSSGAGSGMSSSGSGSSGAGSGGSSSSNTTTSSTVTSTGAPVVFQIGLQGDNYTCTVFQTRMSRAIVAPPDDGSGNQNPYATDVWRISYFLADGRGLARQEIRMVTSEDVDTTPTDVDDNTRILAEEVKSLQFRYFDGTNWQDQWDGSQPGADGVTPMGPPMAVEITLEISVPGSDKTKTIQDIVAFQTAPGGTASQPSSQASSSTTSP